MGARAYQLYLKGGSIQFKRHSVVAMENILISRKMCRFSESQGEH